MSSVTHSSCGSCQNCTAIDSWNIRSLLIKIGFNSNTCPVGASGSHYHSIEIDSTRPKGIDIRLSVSSQGGGFNFPNKSSKVGYIGSHAKGVDFEFEIQKAKTTKLNRDTIETQIEVRPNSSHKWNHWNTVKISRKIS